MVKQTENKYKNEESNINNQCVFVRPIELISVIKCSLVKKTVVDITNSL